MKNLNLNYLKSMDIDYTTVVNHTFDVVEGSILCINHDDNNKLNEYISSSLNKNPKYVITSTKCDIQDEKVLRFEDYDFKNKEVKLWEPPLTNKKWCLKIGLMI